MTARTGQIRLPSFEPGSPEWCEQRELSVGGSEVASVMGFGRFDSRFSLWHRKLNLIPPTPDNPVMEWGRILEPVVAAKFAERHPEIAVRRTGTFTRLGHEYQIASPDRDLRYPDGTHVPLEIKTAYDDTDWGTPGTDEIPLYYRTQCIWYLDLLRQPWCDVAVLIGGSDYREYRVDYDPADAKLMRDAAIEFIDSIVRGDRPDIDAHSATYEALRDLHPEIERDIDVELDTNLAAAYCNAREALKQATDNEQLTKSQVADAMGNARRARWAGHTIATRQARGEGRPFVVAGRDLPPLTNTEEKAA